MKVVVILIIHVSYVECGKRAGRAAALSKRGSHSKSGEAAGEPAKGSQMSGLVLLVLPCALLSSQRLQMAAYYCLVR